MYSSGCVSGCEGSFMPLRGCGIFPFLRFCASLGIPIATADKVGNVPPRYFDTGKKRQAETFRYATCDKPGITRHRLAGRLFFKGPRGQVIRDARTLARVRALVLPPAWTDVWISTDPRAHLQATGHDAAGRKQYRYHAGLDQRTQLDQVRSHARVRGSTLP